MRLPRTLVTALTGANLALAGCILQGVLRNPLADPGIIGVSSGAGLFAMFLMILAPEAMNLVPAAAFIGAVLSTGLVFFLAWEKGINPLRMILAGVAIAAFFRWWYDCFERILFRTYTGYSHVDGRRISRPQLEPCRNDPAL